MTECEDSYSVMSILCFPQLYVRINTKNEYWMKHKGECTLLTSFETAILDMCINMTATQTPSPSNFIKIKLAVHEGACTGRFRVALLIVAKITDTKGMHVPRDVDTQTVVHPYHEMLHDH